MGNDNLALAELLFFLEGLWDFCRLVTGFSNLWVARPSRPAQSLLFGGPCSPRAGVQFLERCTYRCMRTISICLLADPADSFVLVLPAWETMHKHVQLPASYYESTWTLRTHTRTNAHIPYEYHRRKTEQEVKEARLQHALAGSFNTGPMLSSSRCAKGGAGATNFAGDFYPVMGVGKAAQAPYTVTRRRAPQPTAPASMLQGMLTADHCPRCARRTECRRARAAP